MKKAAPIPPAQRLVDDRYAAGYLGVSRSQVRAWVAAGRLPRVRVPGVDGRPLRRFLMDVADLDGFIAKWKTR